MSGKNKKRGFSGLTDLTSNVNEVDGISDNTSMGGIDKYNRSNSFQLMAFFGITHESGVYIYNGVKYVELEAAIIAADVEKTLSQQTVNTSPILPSKAHPTSTNSQQKTVSLSYATTEKCRNGKEQNRQKGSLVGGVLSGSLIGVSLVFGCILIVLVVFAFLVSLLIGETEKAPNDANISSPNYSQNVAYTKPIIGAPVASLLIPYHVTVSVLNLRNKPSANGVVLSKLNRFDTVNFHPNSNINGWVRVDSGQLEGWVAKRFLAWGEGGVARNAYCRQNISRPVNGYVFSQKQKGEHRLTIKNSPGNDVIAKLKDRRGNTVVSFYVREGENVTIFSIPSGSYKFQYASGLSYSRECGGKFLDDMQASEDPSFTNYEITTNGYKRYTSSMEYTLYRVSNGNFRPNSISVNNF